jgi:hypothetical protein
LADLHDEWQVSDRRYLAEGSMAQLKPTSNNETVAAISAATRHRESLESPPRHEGSIFRKVKQMKKIGIAAVVLAALALIAIVVTRRAK